MKHEESMDHRQSSATHPQLATTTTILDGAYRLEKVIERGSFGKVYKAKHILTDTTVAIKDVDHPESNVVSKEIECWRILDHPHIIKLYQVIAEPGKQLPGSPELNPHPRTQHSRMLLVMEWAPGGELYRYLEQHPSGLSEIEAQHLFTQLAYALVYLHEVVEIVHRDIKLENILRDSGGNLKLSDFSFATKLSKPTNLGSALLTNHCGSTAYAAPEVLNMVPYEGGPADIWSLGIVLYALLAGHLPFSAPDDDADLSNGTVTEDEIEKRIKDRVKQGKFTMPLNSSCMVQNLLSDMLSHDPKQRPKAADLLRHPFLAKSTPPAIPQLLDKTLLTALRNLGIDTDTMVHELLTCTPNSMYALYHICRSRTSQIRDKEPTDTVAWPIETQPSAYTRNHHCANGMNSATIPHLSIDDGKEPKLKGLINQLKSFFNPTGVGVPQVNAYRSVRSNEAHSSTDTLNSQSQAPGSSTSSFSGVTNISASSVHWYTSVNTHSPKL